MATNRNNKRPQRRSATPLVKDYFDVLYAGLVCFQKNNRAVLMPDGTNPLDKTVPEHWPMIIVDPGSVTNSVGWGNNLKNHTANGIYDLEKCQIEITVATTPGQLVTTQHDANVLNLWDSDNSFQPAQSPNAIVRTTVGTGTLELFRRPGGGGGDNISTISRLRVPHNGTITITVQFDSEASPRTLDLQPLTDIALANVAYPRNIKKKGNDFLIYGQLAQSGTITPPASLNAPKVSVITKNYQIFHLSVPVNDGGAMCGTSGCCPPP
jgi:hypothetical protein